MLPEEVLANKISEAFDAGWRMAAEWAGRDDLPCDMWSAAYQVNKARVLREAGVSWHDGVKDESGYA